MYSKIIFALILLPLIFSPIFAQVEYREILSSNKGTLDVGLATIPTNPTTEGITTLKIDFINPNSNQVQEHIDYKIVVTKDGEQIFGPIPLTHTSTGSVKIPVEFQGEGEHEVTIAIEGILFQPMPQETVVFNVLVAEQTDVVKNQQSEIVKDEPKEQVVISEPPGGGCLIATATFGSELTPQVQQLREIRENVVLKTKSGQTFMTAFNQFYYSFSPQVADFERENPVFREAVKLTITPMLASLSIINYADIDSEEKMLAYGTGVVLLNIGMYFGIPIFSFVKLFRTKINVLGRKNR